MRRIRFSVLAVLLVLFSPPVLAHGEDALYALYAQLGVIAAFLGGGIYLSTRKAVVAIVMLVVLLSFLILPWVLSIKFMMFDDYSLERLVMVFALFPAVAGVALLLVVCRVRRYSR